MEARARPARGVNLDVALGPVRLAHATTVTVAAGATATSARVSWLGGPFHQLRCAAPLPVAPGSRVTVDGKHEALVLDPDAPRHGPGNDLLVHLTRLARNLG